MKNSNLGLNLETNVLNNLESHWDNKLTPNSDNPFPLAPRDLVKMGVVTHEEYRSQNQFFGDFSSSLMKSEIASLGTDFSVRNRWIKVFGSGLARDLNWFRDVINKGMRIQVFDVSNVACEKVERLYSDFVCHLRLKVYCEEVESAWESRQIGSIDTVGLFASQFVQVQEPEKMRRVLRLFGNFLGQPSRDCAVRRIYLVHPFRRENCGARVFGTHNLESVTWGDTTPYDFEEIVDAIQCGSGRPVRADILGSHTYFHQAYSFLRIIST